MGVVQDGLTKFRLLHAELPLIEKILLLITPLFRGDYHRCLIIDEINRANIDECFGELFTVLAGQSVELPYKSIPLNEQDNCATAADISNAVSSRRLPVKIIPRGETSKDDDENYATFQMTPNFRMIGTMNDADRSALHQFSFALLRRFDVIRVDPPSDEKIEKILNRRINEIIINTESYSFEMVGIGRKRGKLGEKLHSLFKGQSGLIRRNVASVASMIDVCNFIKQATTKHGDNNQPLNNNLNIDSITSFDYFISSNISLALITSLLPQFDSLNDEEFITTIEFLHENFKDQTYLSIDESEQNLIGNNETTVSRFFFREMKKYVRGTIRESKIEEVLNRNEHN